MLTYDFENINIPIYEFIYKRIKEDILTGVLKPDEKLPSKRTFANNNGISVITVQNAYDQLICEGYIYTLPKRGYYVANIEGLFLSTANESPASFVTLPKQEEYEIDLSGNGIRPDSFPFSVWTKVSRDVMSNRKAELMEVAPVGGVVYLRETIAEHLRSFRGMLVDPNQIIVGAGTEYLYGLIVQLLGKNKVYAIENPGYKKLEAIYGQQGVECKYADMDDKGVTIEGLAKTGAQVAHICPNHHFPTGITMPASRRYEVLTWANREEGRYIIEDDYDSEFRMSGKPIPTLFSIDSSDRVIYMNTFSKSLSPTIRISYMVLPVCLANSFYETMSFYACTVSNFEQYTLGQFIAQGYFEKHINRMRLYYNKQRRIFLDIIEKGSLKERCRIVDNDSGLHFHISLNTELTDREVEEKLKARGIRLKAMSDYYFAEAKSQHLFIINYSNLEAEKLARAMEVIADIIV